CLCTLQALNEWDLAADSPYILYGLKDRPFEVSDSQPQACMRRPAGLRNVFSIETDRRVNCAASSVTLRWQLDRDGSRQRFVLSRQPPTWWCREILGLPEVRPY